jgi:hypothetical protein
MVRIDRNLGNFTAAKAQARIIQTMLRAPRMLIRQRLNIPDNEDWEGPNENAYAVWIGDNGERNLMIV